VNLKLIPNTYVFELCQLGMIGSTAFNTDITEFPKTFRLWFNPMAKRLSEERIEEIIATYLMAEVDRLPNFAKKQWQMMLPFKPLALALHDNS